MQKTTINSVFPFLRNKSNSKAADYSKEAQKRQEQSKQPRGPIHFDKGSGLSPKQYGMLVATHTSHRARRKTRNTKAFG